MNILLWVFVILGYSLAIFEIVKVLVFSYSLFSDVPYVPSNRAIAKIAINYLNLKDGDRFIDIGSGDGKAVLLCAKTTKGNISYTGIEIRSFLIFISNLKKYFLPKKNITFVNSDAFKFNYEKFNKVFLYMTTDITQKLLFKLEKELPYGAQVISCVFSPGEFIKSHDVEIKEVKMGNKRYNLYLWTKRHN